MIYVISPKLIDEVREVYIICIAKDWQSVKNALVAHFGNHRDENGLLFNLDQLRQSNSESTLQFYTRVMSNLSVLHNYLSTQEIVATNKNVKKSFYINHAFKMF